EFFEHGGKGHARTLFEEVVHVPLVFRWPARVPEGRRVRTLFGAAHLMPTILGLVGLPVDAEQASRNDAAVVEGAASPVERWSFSEVSCARPPPLYLVRDESTALLGGPPEGTLVVYDLGSDPLEQHPRDPSADEMEFFVEHVERAIGRSPWITPAVEYTDALR